MTCEICGHSHGPEVSHIERTVSGSTVAYVDRIDAERYRWLRENAKEIVFTREDARSYDPTYEKPEDLDAWIDEARKPKK